MRSATCGVAARACGVTGARTQHRDRSKKINLLQCTRLTRPESAGKTHPHCLHSHRTKPSEEKRTTVWVVPPELEHDPLG